MAAVDKRFDSGQFLCPDRPGLYHMVYGIIQLINFAHGEIYMFGAFVGLFLVLTFEVNIFIAILGAMIFCMPWGC